MYLVWLPFQPAPKWVAAKNMSPYLACHYIPQRLRGLVRPHVAFVYELWAEI